jgi:hypothetical protein
MSALCFLALLLALVAAPAHGARVLASGGPATTTANNATANEYLAPHNQARAAVGVPPLRWSPDLAVAAGKVDGRQGGCAFADMGGSPCGANQGWASYRAHPGEVVASWVAQGKFYNHGNNTCAAGRQCGTYTQVVWRRTAEVGCAQATCASGAALTLCLYNPHGNVQEQSPY